MNLTDAKAECQRWLDYLDRQKARSIVIQQIAADRRAGKCSYEDGQKRLRKVDNGLTVYDGARLADAVQFLLHRVT